MKQVAIIGGGMAGLAAAHYLQQGARAQGIDVEWRLFEQRDRLGGKVITDHEQGFVIEGGPDSFITQKPWGLALCRELGLDDELIPCNSAKQKVYILVRSRLCALPAGFRLTVPTRIMPFVKSPLFSWPAKLRMGMELFVPPRRDDGDESISDFITRRLGREAADKIGGPLMAGIYVADPAKLSLLSTFPMFRALERKHGSLIRAMRAAAKRPAAQTPMFMSLRGGMGRLIDVLRESLNERCTTDARITGLQMKGNRFELLKADGRETFDAVIIASPLYETAGLLQELAPESAAVLRGIRYVSTGTVSLGYRLPLDGMDQKLDGFGFVIPASEDRDLLACTWSSVKFEGRAPDGHALFRVFVGGERREHLAEAPDDELIALVRRELRDILGLVSEPVVSRIYRWPKGNPQYDVGHADRMKALMADIAKIPGLHLAGSGYNGIGLPDCIRSGKEAAEAVLRE